MNARSQAGFTLVEMMMTVAVFAILAGAAVPQLSDMSDGMRLRQGLREVERELQAARLKAVSTNRVLRVRFDCGGGVYRMVELIGTASVPDVDDESTDRCRSELYPYPAPDTNRLTLPNHDGPTRRLHSSLAFGAASTLEFWPDGSIHQEDETGDTPWPPIASTGTAITVTKGETVGIITVNGLGKIQIQ